MRCYRALVLTRRGPTAGLRSKHACKNVLANPRWHARPGLGSTGIDSVPAADSDASTSTSSSPAPASSVDPVPAAELAHAERPASLDSDAEPSSSSSTSSQWSDKDLELLWNSVSRALLRVGKAGFQPSHLASLKELVASHTLIKVQLNHPLADGVSVETEIAAPAGATYLKRKGRTLLFAAGGLTAEQLLATANSSMAKLKRYNENRAAVREVSKQTGPQTPGARAARMSTQQEAPAPAPVAEGSQAALSQVLQRVGKGPMDRSVLLQEHEQVLQQLDADEEPVPDRRGKSFRPWQQKKRGPGASSRQAR